MTTERWRVGVNGYYNPSRTETPESRGKYYDQVKYYPRKFRLEGLQLTILTPSHGYH
jgi:hypothetical protein